MYAESLIKLSSFILFDETLDHSGKSGCSRWVETGARRLLVRTREGGPASEQLGGREPI
jgi:hypothetical protein